MLPAVNASLNASSAFLLLLGYTFIRRRAITAHTICMLGSCGTSAFFLISYLVYHFFHGASRFPGGGVARLIYFAVLISHTVLAVAIVPLIILTLRRAFQGRFGQHAALARVTLPLWLYVSVTGVLVYWMIYHLYG